MCSNELISPLLHAAPILLELLLDRKDGLPASSNIAVFRLFSTILFLIGGLTDIFWCATRRGVGLSEPP